MMPDEHVFDLLPAYVIGCLDDNDCQAVTTHLAGCEMCRKGLQAYSRVLDDLPLRVAFNEPPAEIREIILQRASQLIRSPDIGISDDKGGYLARWFFPIWISVNIAIILLSTIVNWRLWRRLIALESQSM